MQSMKKHLFLFLGSFFLLNIVIHAQHTFEKTFGGYHLEFGYAVEITEDGGYIIAGGSESFTVDASRIGYIIKVDEYGDSIWSNIYDFNDGLFGSIVDIQSTKDGGYLLCSYSSILKINSSGDSLWTTKTPKFKKMVQSSDSTYILVDNVWQGDTFYDIGILKINQKGDTIWSTMLGEIRGDLVTDIKKTSDSNYIISATYDEGISSGIWLIKISEVGDTVWTRKYPEIKSVIGLSIQETADKGFIVLGNTLSNNMFFHSLIKTDSNGFIEWEKVYDFPNSNQTGYTVKQTNDGGYIFGGNSYQDLTVTTGLCLVRTDERGDKLWVKQYVNGFGVDLKLTADNGFVLGGYSRILDGKMRDLYILKTDENGDLNINTIDSERFNTKKVFNISIYPNPTHGRITVNGSFKEVKVYSIDGKVILRTNKNNIDISMFNSGMYVLEFKNKVGNIIYKKLIKE